MKSNIRHDEQSWINGPVRRTAPHPRQEVAAAPHSCPPIGSSLKPEDDSVPPPAHVAAIADAGGSPRLSV